MQKHHMPRYPTYYEPSYYEPTISKPIETTQTDTQFIQQFLNKEGQLDIGKVLQTINQLADTVQQVAPVIKQMNDLLKTWKQ